MPNMSVYDHAKRYVDAGLSVIPIATDGTKSPKLKWEPYKTRLPSDAELQTWFTGRTAGIAIVGGAVSGNLERIDFDQPGLYDEWRELCKACKYDKVESTLALVRTPRDPTCYHLYYRCEESVEGNLKLATGLVDSKPKAIIETRGEAGYTLAPGSPATCHETGREYECVRGDLANLPILTALQREAFLELARSFNEYTPPERVKGTPQRTSSASRPGDDYNARGPWREQLIAAGWAHATTRGNVEYWRRPGKKHGISASWNHRDSGLFYPFTSNAFPFESETSYFPFGIFATLQHGGNYAAAAQDLGKQGYGEPPRIPTPTQEFTREVERPAIRRPLSDLGNAERLVDTFGTDIKFVVDWKRWIIWDGTRWAVDRDLRIQRYARETVRGIYAEAQASEDDAERKRIAKWALGSESDRALNAMIHQAAPAVAITSDVLDIDSNLLCCLNGVVDIQKGELLKPCQDNLITKQIAITYDIHARCPAWERFLDRIQPDNDVQEYLQIAAGYSLTGDVSEQCLFFLYGEGKNGKSTFIETLSLLVGDYFVKTGSDSLMMKRYGNTSHQEVAALKGARLVTVSEISDGQRLDEGLVKDMTGGDTMIARHLYGDPFNFKAGFKLWLYGNVKPTIKGKDEGIWRRIRLIPFHVQIPPAERDPHLFDKLKEELPGILSWAVNGCIKWQVTGLSEPRALLEAVGEYRAEQDTLAGFLEAECRRERTASCTKKDLWVAYENWLRESGEPGYEKRSEFFKEVGRIPGIKDGKGTGNVALWRGIRLITIDEKEQAELAME